MGNAKKKERLKRKHRNTKDRWIQYIERLYQQENTQTKENNSQESKPITEVKLKN